MKKILWVCLALLVIGLFGCSSYANQGKPDVKPKEVSADTVPAYVKAEAKRVSDLVRAAQNQNTFTILGVSDMHFLKGDAQIGNALQDMALGIKEVLAQTPVDYKIAFGDYIFRMKPGYENYQDGVVEMKSAADLLNTAFGQSGNQIRLTGNHDANSMQLDQGELKHYFTTHDIYGYVGKYNDKNAVTDSANPEGNYGYIDLPEKKLRIIYLNTSDFTDEGKPDVVPNPQDTNKNTTTTRIMGKRQVQWFIEALKLTGIKDPEAWSILTVSHIDLAQGALRRSMKGNAARILSEYVQKHKGTLSVKGTEIPYDYSGITPARVLPYIHGHNHSFPVNNFNVENGFKGVVRNDMVTIGLPNACPIRNGKGNTYEKNGGTAKSTSFSVIVIDMKSSVVKIFCYGAGFDRTIHFDNLKMKAGSSHIALHTGLKGKVSWKSKDKKVVKAEEGKIQPVAAGKTIVVAEDENGNCEYWAVTVD